MQQSMVTTNFPARLALVLTLLVSIASCSTIKETAESHEKYTTHDTVYEDRYMRDSVFIDRYHAILANDSVVYVRDSVVCYRYKLLRDSVYINKVDTAYINHDTTIVKSVPRRRNWFDYLSYCSLVVIILMVIYRIRSCLR